MPKSSRRDFLVVAGTGAAAAGVLAALPDSADAAQTPAQAPRNASPIVVHIPDPHAAELVIHHGERTSVVRDRDLVVRLLSAAGKQG
jgi:Rieske Fe-S protein